MIDYIWNNPFSSRLDIQSGTGFSGSDATLKRIIAQAKTKKNLRFSPAIMQFGELMSVEIIVLVCKLLHYVKVVGLDVLLQDVHVAVAGDLDGRTGKEQELFEMSHNAVQQ